MTNWSVPDDYISKRIRGIFEEVAEIAALTDMSEDESAGVPMAIFKAENYLLSAWRAYIASGNSEPDNLKQIKYEKETDRGPGLSGSELPEGLHVAEVEFAVRECGHGEMSVKGAYHHLCAKCDDAMVDGRLDEDGRYLKWLRRKANGNA